MNIEIVAITDQNFSLISNGLKETITEQVESLDETTVELPVIEILPDPVTVSTPSKRGPRPVPLENHSSTGTGWFEGTSWGTSENKHTFN